MSIFFATLNYNCARVFFLTFVEPWSRQNVD